ncbi:hypothetical protein DRW03_34440 [Corallococcus sp. H22C18031201]|nr:hypothetical protein [Citreicoccus inhibens]RJS14759.1 hypothetical protein DRW03_34440 [Corallococcus sp. H22C18031201]
MHVPASEDPFMTAYDKYRALLRKLGLVRAQHSGRDSPEEDALLDAMDEVWWEMSEAERSALDEERARALGALPPRAEPFAPPQH